MALQRFIAFFGAFLSIAHFLIPCPGFVELSIADAEIRMPLGPCVKSTASMIELVVDG